eukprot:CAMPEP_0174856014 /NCGR_PEP_ID=MMETSP1114-20130205/34877_1 /TAXON_ID=312471 /ORGANISM="Neobodo designis, Strain CCAP 1951/1" /LENGTH=204 /DNA_ID=CAMNT_0016090789 /DNA_START=52 /DNA_END=662 /DNA_ORIENTATION=-
MAFRNRGDADKGKEGEEGQGASHSYGFLNRLWEQNANSAGFGNATQYNCMSAVPIHQSQVPTMSMQAAVRRETAKPFRMSYLVSTDNAPLPTRTAPPNYTEFRRAPFEGAHPADLSYSHYGALRRKYARDNATSLKNYAREDIDRLHGEEGARNDVDDYVDHGVEPERYRELALQKALADAHMDNLMDTIRVAKMDARRDPLIR